MRATGRWLASPPTSEGFRTRRAMILGFACAVVAGMFLMAILAAVLYRSGVLFPCAGRNICS